MVDHGSYQIACRARAKTLLVCTTGAIAMSATATGYARTVGSFVTDGFAVGMELVASAFAVSANNGAKMVKAVSALNIDVDGGATPEGSAGGRTLFVGLPSDRVYSNVEFMPTTGKTHVEEQYIPGPTPQVTTGPLGELELTPMYSLRFNVPTGTGELAAARYLSAVMALFAPRTAMALSSGDVLRVRSDTGPYPSQLLPGEPGFASQSLTVPLRVRTNNSI